MLGQDAPQAVLTLEQSKTA
jgi:hypothetical protein